MKKYLKSQLNKSRLFNVINLGLVFILIKSLAYVAPLGLERALSSDQQYGNFEYILNLGQIFISIFSVGLLGSYGYHVLKENEINAKPIFHFHFFVLIFLLLLVTLICPTLLTYPYFGAIIIGLGFADQILISGILKVEDRNKFSVVIDTMLYILLGIYVVIIFLNILHFDQVIWHIIVLIYLSISAIFYHLPRVKSIAFVHKKLYIRVYKYGLLVSIVGPLIILNTNSTRIFIEYFLNIADVGTYSFYFRISSLVIILYRIAGILLFKSFFLSKYDALDKRYSLITGGLFIINVLLFFVGPYFLSVFFPKLSDINPSEVQLYLFCLFQVSFWIHTALFEPIFQRENMLIKFIVLLFFSVLTLVALFIFFNHFNWITLNNIVIVNCLIIFIMFYGQQFLFWRKKIFFPRTILVHSVIGLAFLISIFFY